MESSHSLSPIAQSIPLIMFHILSFLFASVRSSSTQCHQLLTALDQQSQADAGALILFSESLPYLRYSGTGYPCSFKSSAQKYGDYDSCLRQTGYSYSVMLSLTNLGRNGYGFCHSSLCSAQDLNQPENISLLKAIVKRTGIDQLLGVATDEALLEFHDPQIENHPPPTAGTIITLVLMATLLVLSLILPVMQLVFKFKTRKQRYKILYGQIQAINETTPLLKEKETPLIKYLKIFSITENYRQFVDLKTPDPNLALFDGIRAISFMMVVFGHQFYQTSMTAYQLEMYISFKKWVILILFDMLYSVDIFFWIGGFFLGFVIVETKKQQSIRKSPFLATLLIVVHRVLRIWPCYILVILLNINICRYLGGGPRWYQAEGIFRCTTWWRSLLFYSTLMADSDCMQWGWYLSVDLELFLACLVPLLIYIMFKPLAGKLLILAMLAGTQAYGIWLCLEREYLINYNNSSSETFQVDYYIKPWTRAPPYLVGLLLGLYYREYKNNIKSESNPSSLRSLNLYGKSKVGRIIIQSTCYTIGFGIVLTVFLAWRPNQLDPYKWSFTVQELWQGTTRTFIVIGLSFLALPNMAGIYDIFNTKLMNNGFFKILAKVSFTGYLIHYDILAINSANNYQTPNFDTAPIVYNFVGNMTITVLSAILLTLVVEQPFAKLEQQVIGLLTTKKKAKQLEDELVSNPLRKEKAAQAQELSQK